MLYPLYAQQWDLTPTITTAVFATYPLALILTLVLFGGISDVVGRRRAMMIGVALIAASAIVFAAASGVGFLFAGRVLQGVGTGLALSAASAALVEHNVSANPRFASSLATVSTSTGLTLALVVSGILAQLAPMPLVWSYVVLFGLGAAALVALWATPDDRPLECRVVATPAAAGADRHPARLRPRHHLGVDRLLRRGDLPLARAL